MGVCCATNINKQKLKDKNRESQSQEVSSGQKKPEIQSYENLKSAGSDLQNQSSDNAGDRQKMKLKKNVIFGNNENIKGISKRSIQQDSNNKPVIDKSNQKADGIKSIFNFGKTNDLNEDQNKKDFKSQKKDSTNYKQDSAKDQNNEGGFKQNTKSGSKEKKKLNSEQKKARKYYNLSPNIQRNFRIYKIQGKPSVQVPYSRDSDWQQTLQIYFGKLNLSTFQANQGLMGNPSQVKNKKQQEILSQLEQIQIHREIELMVSILNLRNRNWIQEQIKMNKRLSNISPQSFDFLVVTREFLQLREHFNWFVWAVSFYYFQMSKVEQFFQYYQQKQIQTTIIEQQKQSQNQTQNQSNLNQNANQKLKQQNLLFHEINHLLGQVNQLKSKLPSPINKKWSDGFSYQGVNFRMMPQADGFFIKNEMKALKYIQNELMELSQIQAQLQDQYLNLNALPQHQSIYKNIILPLLSSVECGGFFIFASPIIYIAGYTDIQNFNSDFNDQLTKQDKAFSHFQVNSQRIGELQTENFQDQLKKQNRYRTKSVISNLYGKDIYLTKNIIENKIKDDKKQKNLQQAILFLQDNIEEIEDPLLKMMPLLKNIRKQNVIPIIDFEDQTQINLNYLLIHGFDCIPNIENNQEQFTSMLLMIPADPMKQIQYVDQPNFDKISIDQVNLLINEKVTNLQNLKLKLQQQKVKSKQQNINTPQLKSQKINRNDSNEISDESSNLHESDLSENSDDNLNSRIQSQGNNLEQKSLLESKSFSKHGFDLIMIFQNNGKNTDTQQHEAQELKSFQQVGPGSKLKNKFNIQLNKRAHSLFSVKEEESNFDGLYKDCSKLTINIFVDEYNGNYDVFNPFIGSTQHDQSQKEQDKLPKSIAAGGGLFNQQKKQSILRKMNQGGIFGINQTNFQQQPSLEGYNSAGGIYQDNNDVVVSQDQIIKGNCLIIAQNYQCEFKLKYPLITHQNDLSLEQIFMKSIFSIAQIIEETDTIFNIQSLKELLHRKGLNLRFEWLLLTKLKNIFNRELVMIHILVRTMKKIINEEVKIKAQVFAPNKLKAQSNFAGKLGRDNNDIKQTLSQKIETNILINDHFIGSNQENFKDNLVFFSNTLLRKKFSKQKHVFDETLISLFLQRLKILPFTHSILKFSSLIKQNFLQDYEILYLQSKQILEEIIAAPSQNPALFLTTIQQYFNIDIEQEFLRKCRQDKYLFLSKLTTQPMTMNNLTNVNLKNHVYYSLKEFSYFMLANTMQLQTLEQQRENYRLKVLDAETINSNLRNQIFKNKISPKRAREMDAPIGGAPGRRDVYFSQNSNNNQKQQIISNEYLNSSSVTDNNKNKFINQQPNNPNIQNKNYINSQNKQTQINKNESKIKLQINLEEKKSEYLNQKQSTPKQFKNIDNIDQRDDITNLKNNIDFKQATLLNFQEELKRFDKDLNPQFVNSEIIIPSILYKINGNIKPFELSNEDIKSIQNSSNFLPYYCMPTSHVFDKWVMYLEHILKDVYSVEGSQQILLESLNYLAINIYFSQGNTFHSQQLNSKDRSLSMMKKNSSENDNFQDYNDYDRDQFIKVCNKIKEYQTLSSKCSPEVIVISQIICGLSYEQANDDSIFPIESEKCYLTALLCLFQIFGDPRGRGNFSVPYMLFVTWKLGLLPISVENRKVYDAEFSEELFDSTLCNLINHRACFRKHQNTKLNRAIYQQEMINRQNILNDIGKEGPNQSANIQQKKSSGTGSQQANFNSRRSHYQGDINELMYKISDFEQQMDFQEKLKNQVDIRCIINPLISNSTNAIKFQNAQQFQEQSKHHRSQVLDLKDLGNHKTNAFEASNQIYKNEDWNINEQKIGPTYNSKSVFNQANINNDKSQTQNNTRIFQEIKRSGLQNSIQPESIKKIIQEDLQNIISKNQTLKKNQNIDNELELNGNFIYGNLPTPILSQQLNRENKRLINDGRAIARIGDKASDPINSLVEVNLSEIDINFDEDKLNHNALEIQNDNDNYENYQFQVLNFSEDSLQIPEVPFVHWSIYRQSIQNVLNQQGHKFQKNQKQMNKFLSQMFKKVLFTSIEKKILRPWLMKYNLMMYQSGTQWKDSQIKQVVVFQTAQMISSRSSSKSSQKNESEFGGLALSMQGSIISQGMGVQNSYRSSNKNQNLGSYSSIINFENGSINKGDVHGVLYSWGSDAQGQLGHDTFSHLTQKNVSQKVFYPRMISVLKEEFIKEVCCGYSHTLAITINGNVYSWGNNESQQLGLGQNCPEFVRKPQMILDLIFIIKLSAGNEHSVAINKNHEIFSWGSMYQTGQNDESNRHTPQQIPFFKNIRIQQIACGGLHTLALSKDHKVYCWGSTEGGQLGLPTNLLYSLCNNQENAVKIPQLITSLQEYEVTQIACGETHSICLCKDGKIFGWGTSMYGQLGLGFSADSFEPGQGMQKSKVPEPRLIESLLDEQISKIFCGSTFSLFLTKSGELYGCGMNDVGQLGEDLFTELSALESAKIGQIQSSDVTIPTQVSSLQGIKIQTVACGEAHVLAIDGDGIDSKNMLWAWGQFKNGQLGLGELNIKLNPRPVQNLSSSAIHKIACGSSHSLALVGDASNLTTLSPNFYSGNEILANSWSIK